MSGIITTSGRWVDKEDDGMAGLVECVPNFSEGRDRAVLDAITREIEGVEGVRLLDVDPGADTNRTVVTFVGTPAGVAEAAFRSIRSASERIDMSKHKGAHPRMGATDVCPFVPVSGVTMDECAEIARRVGERVGRELEIPIYLYEHAATRPDRRSLADIRVGEYEGLEAKLKNPDWKPDFGPAKFNPRAGATVIGAREFLIAYNVNLNTRDKKLANEIALNIRETGRIARGADGLPMVDEKGQQVRAPGLLKAVRAVGWTIEEYGCAQVSINLLNYHVTPVHAAFEACVVEAAKLGLRVTGSELVGLIPLEAIRMAGRYYLARQGKSTGVPEAELVHVAVQSLGLSAISPFDPEKKIIEYQVRGGRKALVDRTVRGFVDELSTDSPAPGGGSVAALCGALGAALGAMVANLTVGKKGFESVKDEMIRIADDGQALKDAFLEDIDRDTDAFNAMMAAGRLPKKTPGEIAARDRAVQEASMNGILVPFGVLERCRAVLDLAEAVAERGNPNSASDAAVAALSAVACAEGAYDNVMINLPGITDREWAGDIAGRAKTILAENKRWGEEIASAIRKRLEDQSEGI
jgi:glutamate formiminotransferase / formiminotetrahydrofolate cyclodeaminase